jgi:hypothetical protein
MRFTILLLISRILMTTCLVFVAITQTTFAADPKFDQIDFSRDIRPILSNTCYACHGPSEDNREAGLRLHEKEGAFSKLESGEIAVVAGDRKKSELFQRILSKNEDEVMPPADFDKKLTADQIELIGRWIDQGADWQGHWSFIKPERPAPLAVKQEQFISNDIDRFIVARLEKEGINPAPEAETTRLIRRLTFDLTGLPPTLKEIDGFLADTSANAYEKVVDRLLRSSRYGEHMTRIWLDAARYGDTHGLHLDNERSIWPYRDWLIKSFNNNLPFDQFTIEQLAGDLLPNPSLDQLVATGFNRCNVTTNEGGSIDEEYRVRYAVDRVEAIGTVFLGLSLNCTVCHEHKFDPISQQEFYKLFAFYANTADSAMDGNILLPPPSIKVPTPHQKAQQATYQQQITALQKQIKDSVAGVKYVDPGKPGELTPPQPTEVVWIDDALPAGASPQGNEGADSWKWVSRSEKHLVFSGEKSHRRMSKGLGQHFFTGAKPGLKISAGDRLFAYVYIDPNDPPREIMLQFNDGSWEHRAYWGENLILWGKLKTPSRHRKSIAVPRSGDWVRLEVDAQDVGLKPGSELNGWAFTQFDGTVYWDKAGVVSLGAVPSHFDSKLAWEEAQKAIKKSSLPKNIQDVLKVEWDKRSEVQAKLICDYFIKNAYTKTRNNLAPLNKQLADVRRQAEELNKAIPSTLVMREKTQGLIETYLLVRGEYNKPDKNQKLDPGVPASLHEFPGDTPVNRFGLAKWLVDTENPLTARVTVNRFWQQFFGVGIVKTTEEFGSQGEWPSHPQLIDWLATEFIQSGWDVKRMQKLIVMSGTYRQSSKVTPELLRKDPENRLLARGPRFRLDAEMIRDNALFLSGLLVEKIGGQSVKPYQPAGLWNAVGYTDSNTANFVQDHGEKLYRRSMYTFWKRTSPPPSMASFDAPSRESCSVRRERTNTPLQALIMMNDIQFVEAARKLAERMMTEAGKNPKERITFAFRLATSRRPTDEETALFLEIYNAHLAEYQKDQQAAMKLLTVGEITRNEKLDASELAAWTMIANLIFNLDETVTKG